MESLTRLTCSLATLTAFVAGCSGTAETGPDTPETGPTACGGSITTEPSVVAVLPDGVRWLKAQDLLAKGTTAYVLNNDQQNHVGTITAVDLCSQTTTTLASFDVVGTAVIVGDAILVSADRGAGPELLRVPLDGGEIATVPLPENVVGVMVRSAGTRVLVVTTGTDTYSDYFELVADQLVRFAGVEALQPPPQPDQYGMLPSGPGVVGASEAGAYVVTRGHGGDTPLQLLPFDGGYGLSFEAGDGVLDIAAWGGRIIVINNFTIISVSPWLDQSEVLLDADGSTHQVRRIVVDDHSICWISNLKDKGAPRCLPQRGGEIRYLHGEPATALALTEGVLLWTVDTEDGKAKLMAAIP